MKKVYVIILCTAIFVFLLIVLYVKYEKKVITSSVLRLHVVAQSNSEYDQAVKLRVRDAVLASSKEVFGGAKSKKEALLLAEENKAVIENAARAALLNEGCCSDVKVSIGKTEFPSKTYGNIRLPSGIYDAVNVKIGEAEGKNWWCIMYPALCFTEGVTGTLDKSGEKVLKEELGEERFRVITETDDRNINIKFKILELF